jgi:hypothetical protein
VELLDLLVRLGRAVGLSHYEVAIRDPRRFEVEATRVRSERSQPIPASIGVPADYASDRVMAGLVLPDQVVAGFDPSRPLPKGLRITEWKPGQSIAVGPRSRPLLWASALACAGAAAACVWGWRLPFFEHDAWILLVAAAGPALLATRLARKALYVGRVDLASGMISVRHGLRSRRIGVSGGLEVVLSRREKRHSRGHTHYTFRLELRGGTGDVLALLPEIHTTNHGWAQDYFDTLHPFSVALASQLARPHRYVESDEPAKGSRR